MHYGLRANNILPCATWQILAIIRILHNKIGSIAFLSLVSCVLRELEMASESCKIKCTHAVTLMHLIFTFCNTWVA